MHVSIAMTSTRVIVVLALTASLLSGALWSGDDDGTANAEDARGTCRSGSEIFVFTSPSAPVVGVPLKVVAVSEHPFAGELVVRSSDGTSASKTSARHGGPPYFWLTEIDSPRDATYEVEVMQRGCTGADATSSRTIAVTPTPIATTTRAATSGVWSTRAAWSRELENLYSAWVETLFDAPDTSMPSWNALHEVLRDRKRNFLFDHLGLGEDSSDAPNIRPDCADLPYFLRAYFALKLGLPFGVAECGRGGAGSPPRCKAKVVTNEDRPPASPAGASLPTTFGSFLRGTVADRAHSGSARIPLDDERSDYYPVPLTKESLRPGTIYADPYGHVLVLAKRLPQTATRSGMLLAVDAQPDGTVARKRFWPGTFLYAKAVEVGGPGWKHFRPYVREEGRLVRWGDDAIRSSPDYGDVSREQANLTPEAFFDAMDDLLTPDPIDPRRRLLELVAALEEQVRTRVDSVDSGRQWLSTRTAPVAMPRLDQLFETVGTWEDYSTPSRDLRLLVAIDFVSAFPTHVATRPARYRLPEGKSVDQLERELEDLLRHELSARTIAYPRSDGSTFTLTLATVLSRKGDLEVAYNPNDCAEARWGAPEGSDEASTCHERAPADQQRRMEELRPWFHDRRRPPRR